MSRARTIAGAVAMLVACVLLGLGLAGARAQESGAEKSVLKIGWAQDPTNINPFTGLDEEAYNVWAINWDLLVNFSPEDLSPAPGIAESWDISEDRKTITFQLVEDATWSDGEPITSEDVKWSFETLGEEGQLFTNYTSNVTSIETPDEHTVVVKTRRPDARIVGGIFVYILPEHIWGKVPLDELNGAYKPELPLVGSGPYVVTEYEKGRILTMERNPEFRGDAPNFDEIQYVKYGTQDAVERALQLGEVDAVVEVSPNNFARLAEEPNIETVASASPAYTELAFNLCPAKLCPDARFNPAVQEVEVRQAIAYAIDRERINAIAGRGTSFPGHGILPEFYKSFFEIPEQDYPYDPEIANQILDDAGWTLNDEGVREKDGMTLEFTLYARSESAYTVQASRLIAEQTEEIGVRFNPQIVSTDKLTELTIQKVDGKPAPDFDAFLWGWGGDPFDPSFLLSLFLTSEIGGLSDSFYSNPEYDRLFEEQAGLFDTAERKAVIQEMVAITQRDVPYVVITYDANLQAYRTDTIDNVVLSCPEDETGDIMCEQAGYEPLLSLAPASGSGTGGETSQSPGLAIVAALVFGIGGWLLGTRRTRRRESEPLELEE